MYRLNTSIEIDASAERVWSLLMDFPAYPCWNPFIRSIEGNATAGELLSIFIQPPGARGMRFRPKVLAIELKREIRWKGKLLMPRLFDGEHYFKLEPKSSGGLVFHHCEEFSGLLVPLFRSSLDDSTKQGFIAMNKALKQEAERRR